jgi:nucleoside-triphosphatase THEP1
MKEFSFSKYIAEVITGPNNQHASITINGRTGSGKSNAGLVLANNIAEHVAKIKGGAREDYFNINHVAIITNEEILSVMEINKKYSVIIIDDAGVGMGARNWQKEENKLLNNILMTMRTDNTCLIVTVPNSFMIDKIPRNLSHWFIEMESANFKKGFTTAKVFQVRQQPRSGKIYYQYPKIKGARVIRTVFKRAPDDVVNPYEVKRTAIAAQLKEASMEDYQQLIAKIQGEKNPEPTEPKITKTARAKEFIRDFKAGVFDEKNNMKRALIEYNKLTKFDLKYGSVCTIKGEIY